jgi:hypothetical protein
MFDCCPVVAAFEGLSSTLVFFVNILKWSISLQQTPISVFIRTFAGHRHDHSLHHAAARAR